MRAGLAAGLATGCASSPPGPAVVGAAARSDEHSATIEAIPLAAVRLSEGPTLALEHWEELRLTVDQLRRLEDLDLRVQRERSLLLPRMEAARNELAAAMDGALADERVRQALDAVGAIRTEATLLTLRAREETLALLDPEQASLLSSFAREHVHLTMMGWITDACSVPSGPHGPPLDALVSDATGAIIPCLPMPETTDDGDFGPTPSHAH